MENENLNDSNVHTETDKDTTETKSPVNLEDLTAEQIAELNKARKEKAVLECQKEVNESLNRHNCEFTVVEVRQDGELNRINVMIKAKS